MDVEPDMFLSKGGMEEDLGLLRLLLSVSLEYMEESIESLLSGKLLNTW